MTAKKDDENKGEGGDTAVTLDSVKKLIDDTLNATVNGAVKAQLKRALKDADFQGTIAEAVKAALKPAKGEGDEDPGEEGDQGAAKKPIGGALPPEIKAMLDASEARVKKLEKNLAEERKIRTDTETKRQRDEERQLLTEALVKGGVQKDMVKPALALLLHEEKRVKRGADGAVLFAHDDEDHDVETGAGKWLASDMGKRFLPQRDGGGTGSPAAGGRGVKDKPGADMPLDELGRALMQLG